MRVALVFIMTILVLAFGFGPTLAQAGDILLIAIHMFDARTGTAVSLQEARVGMESVVRTTDGGIHWRTITPHTLPGQPVWQPLFEVYWLTSNIGWVSAPVITRTHDTALLFHTTDGGQTWQSVTLSLWKDPAPFFGPFLLVDFINPREGWTLAGNDVYHSTDSGTTWTKIASIRFVGQGPEVITFLNSTTGWVATGSPGLGSNGLLYVTRDGGYTWKQQELPLPRLATLGTFNLSPTPPMFFTSHDGILPVVSFPEDIVFYLTHDGGATWAPTTPPFPLPATQRPGPGWYRSATFSDANHGWVTDLPGDTLYVTSDGGRHWTTIRPGAPFDHVAALDFISPRVGWATGQMDFGPLLLKTVDGGLTWESIPFTISP